MYVQDLGSLKAFAREGEDGEAAKSSVLSNCECKVLLRAGCYEDAKAFELLSGSATYLAKTVGESKGAHGGGASFSFSERERAVVLAGDILKRDPRRDGALVVQNAVARSGASGAYSVPVRDITEIPLAVEQLGTVGSREFEAEVIGRALDRMEARAAEARKDPPPPVWVPEVKAREKAEESTDDGLLGFFG